MAVDRLLPTEESTELLGLVRDLCEHELAPFAAKAEETEAFPREAFRTLGKAGLAPYHDFESVVPADVKAKVDEVVKQMEAGTLETGVTL